MNMGEKVVAWLLVGVLFLFLGNYALYSMTGAPYFYCWLSGLGRWTTDALQVFIGLLAVTGFICGWAFGSRSLMATSFLTGAAAFILPEIVSVMFSFGEACSTDG